MNKKVCIFCGANAGNSRLIVNHAKLLCDLLIMAGYDLVYGGGDKGLMGIIANRFLYNDKNVIGIRPRMLIENEDVHEGIGELIVVETMQERKKKMIELSDLFIALPGGVGTLDEIIETFTLHKIGFIKKPSGILNTNGFYNDLIAMLQNMTNYGFLKEVQKDRLAIGTNPHELIENLNIEEPHLDRKREIDKIAFIEIQEGKILMSKSYGKKKYYIPGGKRDAGESDEQTLVREISEELSIKINPETINYYGTFKAQADGKEEGVQVKMTCFTATYENEIQAANEIEELRWLSFSEIDLVAQLDKIIFKQLNSSGLLN